MEKTLAVMGSGGDAPGMNACIRAVVRMGLYTGWRVLGIEGGYNGLIDNMVQPMQASSVSNIIQRGGSILKAGRSPRFMTLEGRQAAVATLRQHGIQALVVIGGDGSYAGARELLQLMPELQIIGLPGTIDNDLNGTDYTIGYDTAINTAMRAADNIRDTADAHNRLFLIEVMGRHAGHIALQVGLASGAEAILVPETPTDMNALVQTLERGWQRHKTSSIVIVAEGDDAGNAFKVADQLKQKFDRYEIKVSILGHIQRGGSPTCTDRVNATRLGAAAIQALNEGRSQLAIGFWHGSLSYTPLAAATKRGGDIDLDLLALVDGLSS